jgi:hypothetical protein
MQRKENAAEGDCAAADEGDDGWALGGAGDNNYGERAIRGGCSNIREPFFYFGRKAQCRLAEGCASGVFLVVVDGGMARASQKV